MIDLLISDAKSGLSLEESVTYRADTMDDAQAQAAIQAIRHSADPTRYHLLMMLLRDQPSRAGAVTSEDRAKILGGAIGTLIWLNDYGMVGPDPAWDGVSALALLQTAKAACPVLAKLLSDLRPAPLFGSETAAVSTALSFRRCDYAARYLALILGDQPAFRESMSARDAEIAILRSGVCRIR